MNCIHTYTLIRETYVGQLHRRHTPLWSNPGPASAIALYNRVRQILELKQVLSRVPLLLPLNSLSKLKIVTMRVEHA